VLQAVNFTGYRLIRRTLPKRSILSCFKFYSFISLYSLSGRYSRLPVTRTLSNSIFPLTRSFSFPSGHFLYKFPLDNSNLLRFSLKVWVILSYLISFQRSCPSPLEGKECGWECLPRSTRLPCPLSFLPLTLLGPVSRFALGIIIIAFPSPFGVCMQSIQSRHATCAIKAVYTHIACTNLPSYLAISCAFRWLPVSSSLVSL